MHFRIEAGGVAQRVVAAMYCVGELFAECWFLLDVLAKVSEAEGDVTGFVLGGQAGNSGGHWIGGVTLDEPEQ